MTRLRREDNLEHCLGWLEGHRLVKNLKRKRHFIFELSASFPQRPQ